MSKHFKASNPRFINIIIIYLADGLPYNKNNSTTSRVFKKVTKNLNKSISLKECSIKYIGFEALYPKEIALLKYFKQRSINYDIKIRYQNE